MNKLLDRALPISIFIATLLNFLLVSRGIPYLYILFIILSLLLQIRYGFNFRKGDVSLILFFIVYLIYVLTQFAVSNDSKVNLIVGTGLYLIFPLYWISVCRGKNEFDFMLFVSKTLPFILCLSLLGIIQYHISPDIFGLVANSNSNNIIWASEMSEVEYLLFFRSTSILASPQVYGLFLVLYIFLVYKNGYISTKWQYFSILICLIGAFHSGNKMVYLILFFFLLMIFVEKFKVTPLIATLQFFLILTILVVTIVTLSSYFEIGVLSRIINYEQILDEESDGRLSIYRDMFGTFNWLYGEGPGYFSTTLAAQKNNYKVAESYFLQFLLENGLMFFLFFMLFCISLIYNQYKSKKVNVLFFLISFFVSMIFVHAHTDPIFAIYWGAVFHIFFNSQSIKFSD